MHRWRPVAILCLIAAPTSVVAFDAGGLVPAGALRATVVQVTVLLLVACAAISPPLVDVGGTQRSVFRMSRLAVLGSAFAAWLLMASLQGADGWHSFMGTPDRRFGFLTWMLVVGCVPLGMRLGTEAKFLVRGSVLASNLIAGVACVQLAGWIPSGSTAAGWRWSGLYGQPAFLGSAAVLFGFVAVAVAAAKTEPQVWRMAGSFGGVGCFVALVGSGTRGAMVGFAVGLLAVMILVKDRPANLFGHNGLSRIGLGRIGAISFLLMGGAFVVLDRGFTRLDEWRIGFRALRASALFGYGPEGYRVVFGQFVTDDYQRAYGSDVITDRAHSGLLDLALVGGVPAMLLFMAGLGVATRQVIGNRAQLSLPLVGMAGGVVAYLVAQQALFPIVSLEPFVALSVGVILGQKTVGGTRDSGEATEPEAARANRTPQLLSIGVGACALVGAILMLGRGGNEVLAEHRLASEAQTRVINQDIVFSAVERAPDSIRVRYAAAQLLVRGGTIFDVDAALDQLEAGLSISPQDPALQLRFVQLLVERATRSGSEFDRDEAWRAALELVEAQPGSAPGLRTASEAAELVEESLKAIDLLERAAWLDSDNE